MGVCTLTYNSGSGSDTAASGSNAPTTAHTNVTKSATVSGTAATTTLTFSATIDLTGVNNDGTDVIWVAGNAGERHLFRITAFTGGVSTCTGLTVSESIGETAITTSNWAIGGKRASFENDTSNTDGQDWTAGWVIELDDNQSITTAACITFGSTLGGGTATTGYSTMKASAAASSRPVISTTSNINMVTVVDLAVGNGRFRFEGLKFHLNNGTATASAVIVEGTNTHFHDCVFVSEGSSGTVASGGDDLTAQGRTLFTKCYFEGGAYGTRCTGDDGQRTFVGCTFKGSATANILVDNPHDQSATEIIDCLIYNGGIGIDILGDYYRNVLIRGCTIVDNTGDGIQIQGFNSSIVTIWNNIIAFNGGYGIDGDGADVGTDVLMFCDYNAFYSNTSGHRNNVSAGSNDVTLTADPFAARATDDYRLNSTAGGGLACQKVAFPGVFPDGT